MIMGTEVNPVEGVGDNPFQVIRVWTTNTLEDDADRKKKRLEFLDSSVPKEARVTISSWI